MSKFKELIEKIKDNFITYDPRFDGSPYIETLDDIFYFIVPHAVYVWVHDVCKWIKYEPRRAYQRATKGHTSDDWWNINTFVRRNCLPMVQKLRKEHSGHPLDMTNKEWNKILDTIIKGWELDVLDMSDYSHLIGDDKKKMDKYFKIFIKRSEKTSKADELFGKYLGHLWD